MTAGWNYVNHNSVSITYSYQSISKKNDNAENQTKQKKILARSQHILTNCLNMISVQLMHFKWRCVSLIWDHSLCGIFFYICNKYKMHFYVILQLSVYAMNEALWTNKENGHRRHLPVEIIEEDNSNECLNCFWCLYIHINMCVLLYSRFMKFYFWVTYRSQTYWKKKNPKGKHAIAIIAHKLFCSLCNNLNTVLSHGKRHLCSLLVSSVWFDQTKTYLAILTLILTQHYWKKSREIWELMILNTSNKSDPQCILSTVYSVLRFSNA